MKKVALVLFLSVCFAQQSCSSDSIGTEPEENPQDILFFKDDFNFFDEKVWTKETHEPGWTNQELQALSIGTRLYEIQICVSRIYHRIYR